MSTKLLISNLPDTVSASALEDMFTMVGDVRAASIEYDESTGASKGVGRVEMSTISQAECGIEHFNGQSRHGRVLAVRIDRPHVPLMKVVKKGRRR